MDSIQSDTSSNILGWISIACWVVVFAPQIITNFRLKSGDGLSVKYVVVGLLGDLFNLIGAVLAGLLPTVIFLALYYCCCDFILLFQIYFYRWRKSAPTTPVCTPATPSVGGETTPLLYAHNRAPKVKVKVIVSQRPSPRKILIEYSLAVLFVCSSGLGAWWVTKDEDLEIPAYPKLAPEWVIQVIGWSSAVLYLGAPIPQIIKNVKTRCKGLSPALFFFAILGDTTYALSICASKRGMDWDYLVTNASWLAGSALAVFLDLFVLCQFFYYRHVDHHRILLPADPPPST